MLQQKNLTLTVPCIQVVSNLLHEYRKIQTNTKISFCRTHHQCKRTKRGKTEKKKRETPNPFSNLIIHTQDYNEQLRINSIQELRQTQYKNIDPFKQKQEKPLCFLDE
jgi:hypothetical protein